MKKLQAINESNYRVFDLGYIIWGVRHSNADGTSRFEYVAEDEMYGEFHPCKFENDMIVVDLHVSYPANVCKFVRTEGYLHGIIEYDESRGGMFIER